MNIIRFVFNFSIFYKKSYNNFKIKKKIDIIIPVKDREKLLIKALNSVNSQN